VPRPGYASSGGWRRIAAAVAPALAAVSSGAGKGRCAPGLAVKKRLKKYLPKPEVLREHPWLAWLGDSVFAPELWHLTRRSVAGGAAVGVFWCFIPIPGQMFIGILTALALRVNIPIAAAGAFISNPVTSIPMMVACWFTGSTLLGEPFHLDNLEWSLEWALHTFRTFAVPITLGAFVLGAICATITYFAVQALWTRQVRRQWKARSNNRSRRPTGD
jgi:uncharacterized protein